MQSHKSFAGLVFFCCSYLTQISVFRDQILYMYNTKQLEHYTFFVQFYGVCVMCCTGNNLVGSRAAKLLWPSVWNDIQCLLSSASSINNCVGART
jgi:hypothetical protein